MNWLERVIVSNVALWQISIVCGSVWHVNCCKTCLTSPLYDYTFCAHSGQKRMTSHLWEDVYTQQGSPMYSSSNYPVSCKKLIKPLHACSVCVSVSFTICPHRSIMCHMKVHTVQWDKYVVQWHMCNVDFLTLCNVHCVLCYVTLCNV